jgi:hypothetical protein
LCLTITNGFSAITPPPGYSRHNLPTCKFTELQQLFGPIRAFAIGNTKEQQTLLFGYALAPGEETAPFNHHAGGLWPIRPDQFHALSRASKDYFLKEMAAHVREFFPKECSRMSQSEIKQLIQHGMERVAMYGINTEQHVCQYVDLLFAFGANYDQEHGSAAEVPY